MIDIEKPVVKRVVIIDPQEEESDKNEVRI